VNNTEGMQADTATAEFHELGIGAPVAISAAHGEGVSELVEAALAPFPADVEPDEEAERHARVAIVGRPNVGKSTLINALVGEERVIAFDQPGTTRDPIEVPFERAGRRYTLIDTAGVRRRGRTGTPPEYFSIVKALQAIEAANVAAMARLSTPKLTRAMIAAVERQAPPRSGLIRPKLRYAHQGGINPPRIIIHGNALDRVPQSYQRYLEGYFRDAFKLGGTPLASEFRTGGHPYAKKAR